MKKNAFAEDHLEHFLEFFKYSQESLELQGEELGSDSDEFSEYNRSFNKNASSSDKLSIRKLMKDIGQY